MKPFWESAFEVVSNFPVCLLLQILQYFSLPSSSIVSRDMTYGDLFFAFA